VKTLLGDQLVEALLRLAQWPTAHSLAQDTIAMLTFLSGTICFVGVSFIRQNALCFTPFYHGSKLWALANIGRGGMDFIHEPPFITLSKTLVA
tara:strand:- start:207 stop:485 length:279 start_codon:yes stop_codon:yes gene_type:complete